MNIAYIHNSKKLHTGAHYINNLIVSKLRDNGIAVEEYYPKQELLDQPLSMKGLANILFFYSLLEYKRKILRNDIIQGTTYTPLTFLAFNKPVISHFGSTNYGFLKNVPLTHCMGETNRILYKLRKDNVMPELNLRTRRPLRDIAEIERYVAQRATKVIAVSNVVKEELILQDVRPENIVVIPNAIEDFWFDTVTNTPTEPHIVYTGRLGNDSFTWKLKGLDRLLAMYAEFPEIPKLSLVMSTNVNLQTWLQLNISRHTGLFNILKSEILSQLQGQFGSIFLLTSRYEGFSLSLIEAMSQGLVPVVYSVGIVPEIIEDGKNGYVVDTNDDMHARISELLNDRDKRMKMAVNSQKTAGMFRAKLMTNRLSDLYQNITEEKFKDTTFHSGLRKAQSNSVFFRT